MIEVEVQIALCAFRTPFNKILDLPSAIIVLQVHLHHQALLFVSQIAPLVHFYQTGHGVSRAEKANIKTMMVL